MPVRLRDPKIPMTAAVGEIDQLFGIGTQGRRLGLAGLFCDTDSRARVVRWRSDDRKFPDIRLNPDPAGEYFARVVHVRFHVGDLAECKLPIAAAVPPDGSQVVDGRI